jgi:hypothetical protein
MASVSAAAMVSTELLFLYDCGLENHKTKKLNLTLIDFYKHGWNWMRSYDLRVCTSTLYEFYAKCTIGLQFNGVNIQYMNSSCGF